MTEEGSGHVEHLTEEEAWRDLREGIERTVEFGQWEAVMWWPPGSTGGPAELTVRAKPGADPRDVERGISTGTLRSIPLTEGIEEMRQLLQATDELRERMASAEGRVEEAIRYIKEVMETDPKPGRGGRSPVLYAAVALAYSWFTRWEHDPIGELAKATHVGKQTAANWVRAARGRGMLTRPTRRQAGGRLTDKALELLKLAEYDGGVFRLPGKPSEIQLLREY
jgi:hypothetical protein